jgi:hypothetical protein
MKHTSFPYFGAAVLSAAFLTSLPLRADDAVQVVWTNVCGVATGRTLTVTSADGSTVEGHCMAIQVDSISVQTRNGPVKVARAAVSRIEMAVSRREGHQLHRLGDGIRKGLQQGLDWTFSTFAPLGIVTVPAVLGWAAVSAPFCALGDLHDKITHASEKKREIKVI